MADSVPDFAPPEIECPACHVHGSNQVLVHPGSAVTLAPLLGGMMGWLTERYGPEKLRKTGGAFRRAWLDGLAEAEPAPHPHYVCLSCKHTWPVDLQGVEPLSPPVQPPPAVAKPVKPPWTPPIIRLEPPSTSTNPAPSAASKPSPSKTTPLKPAAASTQPVQSRPLARTSVPPSKTKIKPAKRAQVPSKSIPPRSAPRVASPAVDRHILQTHHRQATLRWHRARGPDALDALGVRCPVCGAAPSVWCTVE